MTRRRRLPGAQTEVKHKVCAFRLDECADQKLQELASRFATSPSQYARAILTTHLQGEGLAQDKTSSAHTLDELGIYLHQVRDELRSEAEQQAKRLDAVAARMNALIAHTQALTKRVGEVDQRLGQFLAHVHVD